MKNIALFITVLFSRTLSKEKRIFEEVFDSRKMVHRLKTGSSIDIYPKSVRGYPRLAAVDRIRTPDSGFLQGDAFEIRLDLRLRSPENEIQQVSTDSHSGIFVVRSFDLYRLLL